MGEPSPRDRGALKTIEPHLVAEPRLTPIAPALALFDIVTLSTVSGSELREGKNPRAGEQSSLIVLADDAWAGLLSGADES
jgi:hypothetical protein